MKSNKYGIYNVGSSKVISKYQFGKLLIKLQGAKSKIKKTIIYRSNLVAKRPQFMGMNINLFNKTFIFNNINIKNEILKEIYIFYDSLNNLYIDNKLNKNCAGFSFFIFSLSQYSNLFSNKFQSIKSNSFLNSLSLKILIISFLSCILFLKYISLSEMFYL